MNSKEWLDKSANDIEFNRSVIDFVVRCWKENQERRVVERADYENVESLVLHRKMGGWVTEVAIYRSEGDKREYELLFSKEYESCEGVEPIGPSDLLVNKVMSQKDFWHMLWTQSSGNPIEAWHRVLSHNKEVPAGGQYEAGTYKYQNVVCTLDRLGIGEGSLTLNNKKSAAPFPSKVIKDQKLLGQPNKGGETGENIEWFIHALKKGCSDEKSVRSYISEELVRHATGQEEVAPLMWFMWEHRRWDSEKLMGFIVRVLVDEDVQWKEEAFAFHESRMLGLAMDSGDKQGLVKAPVRPSKRKVL